MIQLSYGLCDYFVWLAYEYDYVVNIEIIADFFQWVPLDISYPQPFRWSQRNGQVFQNREPKPEIEIILRDVMVQATAKVRGSIGGYPLAFR
jgi:hypothetical protein